MSRTFCISTLLLCFVSIGIAEDDVGDGGGRKQTRRGLKEPVLRISKARLENNLPARPETTIVPEADKGKVHPLDPAIGLAKEALQRIQATVVDYSCTIVKQERINGELLPQEYMFAEVRNRKIEHGQLVTPFSVYLYFLKPDAMKGREVAYIENANEGKLVGQEGSGLLGKLGPVKLDPRGPIAMRGNRYPITDIGIENLVSELIKRGERDRLRDECTVEFKNGVMMSVGNGAKRPCRMLEVKHPVERPHFDFHVARVLIDEEMNLPVHYEAYTWPTTAGGNPELQERYTYINLKLNIGLKDDSFSSNRFRK